MATHIAHDGRKYEIGKVYYTGSILQAIRHGDPRVIYTDIAADELDEFAEDFPMRIYTSARRQKRKQNKS